MIMAEYHVNIMLAENKGDYFATAREIDRQYKKGILTEEEYLERMDILSAKGFANKWA